MQDRRDAPAPAAQKCQRCGMEKGEWRGNNGQGFDLAGQTYCCQGCAIGTGCTCR